jgi:D-alanyl-D-alanine carboxypeptidase (penicillin-binding protein 5/6)
MDTSGLTTRLGAAAAAAAFLTVASPAAPARADGEHQRPPRPAAGGSPLHRTGVQVRPKTGAPALPPWLSASSWMVTDASTGRVLAAKDAHLRLAPASTLKTLFAVTVLPRLPQQVLRTVTEEDLAGMGPGSSQVGIEPGRRYTVSDLWKGVFLQSGNDAVRALAAMNGSVSETLRQMVLTAHQLHAYDTRVMSLDGYDTPGQVSSAHDLTLFARTGLADADFARYSSTRIAAFPTGRHADGTVAGTYQIQNTNRLLTGAPGLAPYRGLVGVKNGYTSNAGSTLVAAARRSGRTLLVAVMNPRSGTPHAVYHEARALLDWGFAASGKVLPVGSLPAPPGRSVTSAVYRRPVARPAPSPSPAARTGSGAAAAGPVTTAGVPWSWWAVPLLAASAGSFALSGGVGVFLLLRRRGRAPRRRR